MSTKYKTKYFFFLNTNINPTYHYAEELSYQFIKNNLNILWTSCINFRYLDKNLLKKLRKAGAIKLIYGLESASKNMLDYIKKGITLKKARKMLKYANKIGIWNEIELIAGLPHETLQDINNTIKFIKENKKYINYAHLAKFVLMNSKLTVNPAKYKISNIKDNMGSIYNLISFPRSFNEINGLKWNEKIKQIDYSFNQIDNVIGEINRGSSYDDLHKLFYLYSTFKKKTLVVLKKNLMSSGMEF